MPTWRLGLVSALALTMALAPGCSALLDFDDDELVDAGMDGGDGGLDGNVDGGDGGPDGGADADLGGCETPNNDVRLRATQASGLTMVMGDLCRAGDHDFYQVGRASSANPIVLDLSFTAANGDLDLRLYNSVGNLIATAETAGGATEMITRTVLGTPFYVEVYDDGEAGTGAYTLMMSY